MKLLELLNRIKSENKPVFINSVKGRITEIGEELLALETIRKENKWEGRKRDTVLMKETIYIPLSKIDLISEGEVEIPKSKEQKNIEKELEEAIKEVEK